MDIRKKFGEKVRLLRRSNNLSQEAFANQAHIDRTYIADIESGSRNVSLLIIEKIALGFNLPIKDLFDEI